MADTLKLTVAITGAENVSIPTLQPGSALSASPGMNAPLFTFSQQLLPATGLFTSTRLQFTPAAYNLTVTVSGTNALLVVDDPAFASNASLQVSTYTGGNFIGAVNGFNAFGVYAAAPVSWPTAFTFTGSSLNVVTETAPNTPAAPTVAFGATLYTW